MLTFSSDIENYIAPKKAATLTTSSATVTVAPAPSSVAQTIQEPPVASVPSSLAITCLTLPPYLASWAANITTSAPSKYEFVPSVDVDFSFLATDESFKRYPLLYGEYGI
jgi:hypothetical protein